MNKARREIAEAMPRVQLIIEVLDARIPFSSENPWWRVAGRHPHPGLEQSGSRGSQSDQSWMGISKEGVTAVAVNGLESKGESLGSSRAQSLARGPVQENRHNDDSRIPMSANHHHQHTRRPRGGQTGNKPAVTRSSSGSTSVTAFACWIPQGFCGRS